MKNGPTVKMASEKVILALTEASTSAADALHRHVFRKALHALVKLASAGKILEMKRDVALSIGLERARVPAPRGRES